MNIELTSEEIELIIKALEILPAQAVMQDLMVNMFSAALSKPENLMSDEELDKKRQQDAERERKNEESQKKQEVLKRQSEIVKAKLILYQQEQLSKMGADR